MKNLRYEVYYATGAGTPWRRCARTFPTREDAEAAVASHRLTPWSAAHDVRYRVARLSREWVEA